MEWDRPTISIPLDAVASGDTVIVLTSEWLSVNGRTGVEIESIRPASVRILLQPIDRRAYPPALRLDGTLPDSLALAGYPVADPPEIRVSGPRSRLAAIDSVPLTPIDLSAISSSGTYLARVDTTALAGLDIQPRELNVLLQFEEKITASVSDIPIRLPGTLQEESDLLLRFSSATAIVQGARSVVAAIDPLDLTFVADTTGATLPAPGEEMELPLTLLGLSPLLSGEARPETVTVRNVQEDGN
jgi:YbbR domain-containing protein